MIWLPHSTPYIVFTSVHTVVRWSVLSCSLTTGDLQCRHHVTPKVEVGNQITNQASQGLKSPITKEGIVIAIGNSDQRNIPVSSAAN